MSSNPMFKDSLIQNFTGDTLESMSIGGTINKTITLLLLACLSACYTWHLAFADFGDKLVIMTAFGAIAGFICVLVAGFQPRHSMILSITYALCEGLVLGAISAMYSTVAVQAVIATFITVFVMLFLYKIKAIRVTETFKKVLFIALISITVFYLLEMIGVFFHIGFLNSLVAADNSLFVRLLFCTVASLFLVLDFDNIEKYSSYNVPRYFEWYFGMSLMVTIVWLYIEILKLLGRRK